MEEAFSETLKCFETTFALHDRTEHSCAHIRCTRNLATVSIYSWPAARGSRSFPKSKISVHVIALVMVERDTYLYYRRHLSYHALLNSSQCKAPM